MAEYVEPLFLCPLLPIANADDAELTCATAFPHVAAAGGRAPVVHVVEKAGGVPDKINVGQREEVADELLGIACRAADDTGVDLHVDLRFITDVGDTIFEAVAEVGAMAIVFTPRGGRLWWDLFPGAVHGQPAQCSDHPVVVLPAGTDNDGDAGGET